MESQGPFGTIVDSFYSSRIGFLGPEILPGEFVLAPGIFLYDFCNLFKQTSQPNIQKSKETCPVADEFSKSDLRS